MDDKTSKQLCDKAREFGRMVASTKIDGLPPNKMLALCSMCQEIDSFLKVFKK